MFKFNILIITLVILSFIGIVNSQMYRATDAFYMMEPPHFLRRLGLAPSYCPYRAQYY